jgi:hypothetical protein
MFLRVPKSEFERAMGGLRPVGCRFCWVYDLFEVDVGSIVGGMLGNDELDQNSRVRVSGMVYLYSHDHRRQKELAMHRSAELARTIRTKWYVYGVNGVMILVS